MLIGAVCRSLYLPWKAGNLKPHRLGVRQLRYCTSATEGHRSHFKFPNAMFTSRDFSFIGAYENDSQACEAYLARVAIWVYAKILWLAPVGLISSVVA